jgi:hypothetical protein
MHASSVLSVLQHVAVLAASAVAQHTQARCSTLKMRLACVLLLATHMHAHMRTCTRTAQKSMQCKQCFCIAGMHIFCLRCCVLVLLCACKQQQAVRKCRALRLLLHKRNKKLSTKLRKLQAFYMQHCYAFLVLVLCCVRAIMLALTQQQQTPKSDAVVAQP